uniref:Uncharacterized protein n=1 Tax=Anopheles arabiensis TaxID=7173 RepID=A0A182HFM0_ANOAR
MVVIERFSRWEKLVGSIARIHWLIKYLKHKFQGNIKCEDALNQEQYVKAEITLCIWAQKEHYEAEIKQMLSLKQIPRSSTIYKLCPFLDEQSVMRMRGRIGASPYVPYGTKYPIILSQKSRITFLLVDKFHRRYKHGNRETVVNELRQQYYVPKLRALIAHHEALTPNHFLLGSSSGIKQIEVHPTDIKSTLRSSWKLAQHLLDSFWRRWLREYLPVITRQDKWFTNIKDIKEGDVVFVIESGNRNTWRRGLVTKLIKGKDDHVRQAWVKTSTGLVRRPAVKLALIDVQH